MSNKRLYTLEEIKSVLKHFLLYNHDHDNALLEAFLTSLEKSIVSPMEGLPDIKVNLPMPIVKPIKRQKEDERFKNFENAILSGLKKAYEISDSGVTERHFNKFYLGNIGNVDLVVSIDILPATVESTENTCLRCNKPYPPNSGSTVLCPNCFVEGA